MVKSWKGNYRKVLAGLGWRHSRKEDSEVGEPKARAQVNWMEGGYNQGL